MRGLKRSPGLAGLGVLLVALVAYAGQARADIATDQPGSLVIFPKVIADGSRDTVIQIANTSNSFVSAHCVYVNNAGACAVTPGLTCDVDADCPLQAPPNPNRLNEPCVHVCREADFDIRLTAQQPTIWRAGLGRSGLDFRYGFPPALGPAGVPATGPNFIGELKCVQVAPDGLPTTGNALKGEAMIADFVDGTLQPTNLLSEYNAISVRATRAGSNALQLDNVNFNACPAKLIVPHYAEGAIDGFTGARVTSELSLVACTELLEPQTATYSNAQILTWDEFETRYSASVQFGCSLNRSLTDIDSVAFDVRNAGSLRKTTIRPQNGRQCYSGDARCHLCGVFGSTDPALQETDSQCNGVPPNTLVGNCNCSSDADCPGFVTIDSVPLGCRQSPGLLGVVEEFYDAGLAGVASAAINIYHEGSRPGDVIVLPEH